MNYDTKIFAAQLRDDLPTLDLHGLYPNEAVDKIDPFLFNNFSADDEQVVKIIYGGGTGKLGEMVIEFLQNHKMVKYIEKEFGCCLVVV